MSGLAAVLAGRRAPGVYRWVSALPVEDVRRAVAHAGWSFGYADGWTHPGKAWLLAELGRALDFPAYYGQNLDALVDCLSDVRRPTVLLWEGWGPLAREDTAAYQAVVEVLADRATAGPAFVVLLRGGGPEEGLPVLD